MTARLARFFIALYLASIPAGVGVVLWHLLK